MDHQPRPGVSPKKAACDRLIRLAGRHPDWVLGFQDEVWWSRLARPGLHAWADREPMRLHDLPADAAEGKRALLLVWDNASWHVRGRVRSWIKAHNRRAKAEGGVRIVACGLPIKAPWLNRIEPKWVHGKRAIVDPGRKLSGAEIVGRVCDYYGCERLDPISQHVA